MLELQKGDFLEYCRSGMEVISHRERAIRFASSPIDVEVFLTSRDSGPRREPLNTVGYTSSYEERRFKSYRYLSFYFVIFVIFVMDLELRGFKGSLRFLKTWEGTWDENCKIASKVREKTK